LIFFLSTAVFRTPFSFSFPEEFCIYVGCIDIKNYNIGGTATNPPTVLDLSIPSRAVSHESGLPNVWHFFNESPHAAYTQPDAYRLRTFSDALALLIFFAPALIEPTGDARPFDKPNMTVRHTLQFPIPEHQDIRAWKMRAPSR
jgi:hypothetical protein